MCWLPTGFAFTAAANDLAALNSTEYCGSSSSSSSAVAFVGFELPHISPVDGWAPPPASLDFAGLMSAMGGGDGAPHDREQGRIRGKRGKKTGDKRKQNEQRRLTASNGCPTS